MNDQIAANIINTGPEIIVRWLAVAGLVMYAFFALVVLRQAAIMTETLESEANGWVKLLAWVHLGAAVALAVLGLVWL